MPINQFVALLAMRFAAVKLASYRRKPVSIAMLAEIPACAGMTKGGERGNALFLILIAVALFAALSYAITQSGRGGGNIDREQAKLDAAVAQQCIASIEQAVMRLKITGGCTDDEISYEYNGLNVNADAPADKHCHVFDPAGAGETACGVYLAADPTIYCNDAASGQICPSSGGSVVYVSSNLGYRLYTSIADQGQYNWDDANSTCNGLGEGWHLPSQEELNELYLAKNTGSLNGTFNETGNYPAGYYWSSTPVDDTNAWLQAFNDGDQTNTGYRYNTFSVRCVRSSP